METPTKDKIVAFEIDTEKDQFIFPHSIKEAQLEAEKEQEILNETVESIQRLQPNCDKLDYALAASSGALCGIVDVFLVGKPGESPLGVVTDQWFANRTKDFARLCGWIPKGEEKVSSAIRFLEQRFKIPYDQTGRGDAGRIIFDLSPNNHHFKSLAHNPSLLGVFFSILDQFMNKSHFVSEGELIGLQEADGEFILQGNNLISKFFCGIANWFGHLLSDGSGASSSKGRGMGIPSPLWTWTNDIIVLKRKLHIPVLEFDKNINELALRIFQEGFDARFQTTQIIPVIVNEMLVRLIYSLRRLVKYFHNIPQEERSASLLWENCTPFDNTTVKRMLTVAHGTFCLMDLSDGVIRAFMAGKGSFNLFEFCLRLNVAGLGRFTISLYGESRRSIKIIKLGGTYKQKEKAIVENYLSGLKQLSELYDDRQLIHTIKSMETSGAYIQAFLSSVQFAEKRNVPPDMIRTEKAEIDSYFMGGRGNA